MKQERKILKIEYTAIILLWIFVIISPLLFMDDFNQNWRAVHIMWAECSVVGFAFLVNRFYLMPRLFFEKRYAEYVVALALLFFILSVFILYFDGVNLILSLFGEGSPQPMFDNPRFHDAPPHGMPHGGGMPPAVTPPSVSVIPPAVIVLILSAIVIALDMGLSIAIKWIISEQKQAEIKRERVVAQLSNLQSQVSPHFFMNTLNNIHALVDIDPVRAKQTIIELSALMDYLLYESSNQEKVSLQRELEFIGSYISLMRLRFPTHVKIYFLYDDKIPQVRIPPLLFLNFIENAFKYGVDYEQDSFIKIAFNFNDDIVEMTTINSNYAANVKSGRHGLGISNSRKRLELLYGERFTLDISEKDQIFYVNLKIPLS
ncbi:MAG: histidine kinase [Rikenellaceae bacterium]